MHSSISNSNLRLPEGLRGRELVLTMVFFLASVTLSEAFLRWHGLEPSVADSLMLWSIERGKAEGAKVIAIAGASRSLLGLDPDIIARECPGYRVVHLGIDGQSSYAVLEDLALEPAFRGIVLCDDQAAPSVDSRSDATPWVNFYWNNYLPATGYDKRANEHVRVWIQARLALCSTPVSLRVMLVDGPYTSYQHMRSNRFRPADYSRLPPERLAAHRQWRLDRIGYKNYARAKTKPASERDLEALRGFQEQLSSRGGRILMVRMPTSGEHWLMDELVRPRSLHWDPIQDATGVVTFHFKDESELKDLVCPDTSHLNADQAVTMSQHAGKFIFRTMLSNR